MFITTPEARPIPLDPTPPQPRERFVTGLNKSGGWSFRDTQGEYADRTFLSRRFAQMYVDGIEAWLRGDEELAGTLMERCQYEAQRKFYATYTVH